MALTVSQPVEHKDRTVVLVTLPDGTEQPFYRSTGRSSKMPDRWLPFDGIRDDGWFIKHRFARNDKWHRIGNAALWVVGMLLLEMNIPKTGRVIEYGNELNLILFKTKQQQYDLAVSPPYDDVNAVCRSLHDANWTPARTQ